MNRVNVQISGRVAGLRNLPDLREFGEDGSEIKRVPPGSIPDLKNQIAMLEQALQDAREEAFQAGYDEGRQTLLSEVKGTVERLPGEFNRMVKTAISEYQEMVSNLSTPVLELALTIARKVIGDHVKDELTANEILLSQIERFIHTLESQSHITILVNPGQIEWLEGLDLVERLQITAEKSVRFRKSAKLKPGECIIETEDYHIDGTFNKQLKQIEEELLGEKK